jgi:SAM-dependent methyltransferase
MPDLDDPGRYEALRATIKRKFALRHFYESIYREWQTIAQRLPKGGLLIELGAGASFSDDFVPTIQKTDVIAYPGVDCVLDATRMALADASVSGFFLMNVLHHIPDAETFFAEAQRTLVRGGKVVIFDQYPGPIARPILRHLHHEPFDDRAAEWRFDSAGPLSDANGALAWIIFYRDRARFTARYPQLKLARITPHSALHYWATGGLKAWTLIPKFLAPTVLKLDRALVARVPRLASFITIELERL